MSSEDHIKKGDIHDAFDRFYETMTGGKRIEREATNPEGGAMLRDVILGLEDIRDSWNEAYDGLVALIGRLSDTADAWEGKPYWTHPEAPLFTKIIAGSPNPQRKMVWGQSTIDPQWKTGEMGFWVTEEEPGDEQAIVLEGDAGDDGGDRASSAGSAGGAGGAGPEVLATGPDDDAGGRGAD